MTDADVQQENVDFIKSLLGSGALSSFKTGNAPRYDALRSLISDEYIGNVGSGIPYGREYRGWQGYQDLGAEIRKFWSELRMVSPQFIPYGNDKVLIHFTLQGRIAKNGQHVEMPMVSIWGIKEGKACSFRVFYFDTKRIADLAAM